jgi:GTP-binding protein
MHSTNFVDYVKLYCTSGRGGAGAVSFRREKYVDAGGPDGGDGGRGGNILLRANRNVWTLLDLKYRKFLKADAGNPGSGARKTGRSASDLVLEVPVGTVARDDQTGEIIGEVTQDGQTLRLCKGGRGGLGNWHFRSSANQVPEYAQTGEDGETREVILELKTLADVGLVGFPNAGKSTLLASLTSAKPQIADYAFTTLVPNLGIVRHRDYQSFVMADIPGLIAGASEGRGLGTRFLRHIERNAVLLYLIPIDTQDAAADLRVLRHELEVFEPELLDKPSVLAITKCDLADPELIDLTRQALRAPGVLPPAFSGEDTLHFISAATGLGLQALTDALWTRIVAAREAPLPPQPQPYHRVSGHFFSE